MKFTKLTNLVLVILFLSPFAAYAQKDTREVQTQLSYEMQKSGPFTGNFDAKVDRQKINQITAQIREAKRTGDIERNAQLNQDLEDVSGNVSIKSGVNNNGPQVIGEVVNEPVDVSLLDYNLTILSNSGFWSVATSTDRVNGLIWVVGAQNNSSGGSDTLKVFSSTDNGISWTLVYRLGFTVNGVHFNSDEIDVEAVNNGTNSYAFTVAGLSYSATEYSFLFRINSTGTDYFFSYLFNSAAGIKHNYPRITSDNSNYSSGSYVYFILTQDSTTNATHHLKTKYGLLTSPFVTTPTITYRNNAAPTGSYWWNLSNCQDTTKLYNDIVYTDSASTDIILTATNFYRAGSGYNNIYLAYTKDYGVTTPTWFPSIVETNVNYKPRLASTGFDNVSGMQHVMLAYTRQYSSTDWDPYYRVTTNNGSSWVGGYVDSSTDTTFYTDVIAIPKVPNTYRFAYGVKSGLYGNVFTRSYNNGSFPARFQLNPGLVSGGYTPIRAGYRYTTDSCFNVVEGIGGGGLYAYSGCSGPLIGIGNNETPLSFKLSQNYPNPFNPTTKISYSLPKSGLVTIRVYDILGKEVLTLVNEVKNAGNYSVDFNAVNLTSGVYFYKIETSGFSDIKRMMLIK